MTKVADKPTHHGHAARRIRKALQYTEEYVADKMCVTQQTISRYEKSPVLKDEVLTKLAVILKTDVDVLKGMEDDERSETKIGCENLDCIIGNIMNAEILIFSNPETGKSLAEQLKDLKDLKGKN